jgi:hypothetical protein
MVARMVRDCILRVHESQKWSDAPADLYRVTPIMKTWIIVGIISAFAASLFTTWQRHEASKPEHQRETLRKMEILHHEHPDWTVEQLAGQIASDAARGTGIGVLVTILVAIVLYAVVAGFFGEHWWYLAIAFVLGIGGAICIALT